MLLAISQTAAGINTQTHALDIEFETTKKMLVALLPIGKWTGFDLIFYLYTEKIQLPLAQTKLMRHKWLAQIACDIPRRNSHHTRCNLVKRSTDLIDSLN